METIRRKYLWVLSLILAPACILQGTAFIVSDGKPGSDIVVAVHPTRSANLAARELQTHIRKMTGAQLPIVTQPDKHFPVHIYVGRSVHTDRLKINAADLRKDMYKIVAGRDWLALMGYDFDYQPWEPAIMSRADGPKAQADWEKRTGQAWFSPQFGHFKLYNKELDIWQNDGVGTLYAVYDYLRSLGIEWYLPGDLGEIIPKRITIGLPAVNKTVRPDFGRRKFTFVQFDGAAPGIADDILWYFRIGLGDDYKFWASHSLNLIIGHPENKKKHPEYYALYHGKRDTESRTHGKPCLSSPELFDATVRYARAYFDNYPEAEMFPVMPPDAYSYLCECPLCKGKDTPQRGYAGRLSDYVWSFVDRVAGELEKSHPGKKISCCAYSSYLLPPEKIARLHDNVVVVLCRWRLNDDTDPGNRPLYLAIRQGWVEKIAPGNLGTWDYYLQGQAKRDDAGIPVFFPHCIVRDLKSLQGVARWEFVEGARRTNQRMDLPGINHLNYFVTARYYWNVGQDIEPLLDRYYREFFGPAGPDMKTFHERAEKSWWKLEAADIEQLLGLLDRAAARAGDSVYGKRIALMRSECEPMLKQKLLQKKTKADHGTIEVGISRNGPGALDGRLDKPFWQTLPEYTLRDVVSGETPAVPTTFKVAWDGQYLYGGILCREPAMSGLKISGRGKDDTSVWIDDSVELILRTPEHNYYQIAINPDGAYVDADRAQSALNGVVWNSGLEVATLKGADFWSVEIRLPLKSIQGGRPTAEKPWHLNVGRVRPREKTPEISAFVPGGKKTFHDTEKMVKFVVN